MNVGWGRGVGFSIILMTDAGKLGTRRVALDLCKFCFVYLENLVRERIIVERCDNLLESSVPLRTLEYFHRYR